MTKNGSSSVNNAQLHKNVGSFWGAVFQSVAYIAPAGSAASFLVVEAGYVGTSLPFTFLLAILGVASSIFTVYYFSRRMVHAGGYYAYVSAGLGPKFASVSSWFYIVFMLTAISGFAVTFFSGILWPLIPGLSNLSYGWIPISFIPLSIIFLTLFFGLKPSLYYTLIGGALEIGFLIFVSLIIIISVGHNNTLVPFTPHGNSFGNIGYATLYAILSFGGVGQVVMIAEEMKTPKKKVPHAIVGALILSGIAFLMISYALVVGWGFSSFGSFSTATNPGFTVVAKYIGPIGLVIFIAITLNSFISNGIAEGNSFTRAAFAMARESIFYPQKYTLLNKYGSPSRILAIQFIFTIATAYGIGIFVGPFEAGALLSGFNAVFLYIIHIMMNASLPVYGKRRLSVKTKDFLILVFAPMASMAIYLFAIVSVFYPLPSYPADLATFADIIVIVLAIFIGAFLFRNKSKTFLENIGKEKFIEEDAKE
jgi:amino acid transporter